jgi:uncharacterized membrane protein YdbT with pleckstrin-like domain
MNNQNSSHTIARQNPIILALRILTLSLIFNLGILLFSFISDYAVYFNNATWMGMIAYDTLSYLILMIIQFIISAYLIAKWYNKYHFVEDNFIVYRSGIFFPKEKHFRLSPMTSISLNQSFFGKVFKYGTIIIENQNDKEGRMALNAVANPEEFIASLKDKMV